MVKPEEAAKKTILIIEDNPDQRMLFEANLKSEGYKILAAENGADGLKIAQEQKPDLILLDIVLPDIRGTEVLAQLRKAESTKDIPVLVLTVLNSPNDIVHHFEMGADNHLVKPIKRQELLDEVRYSLYLNEGQGN